MVDSSTSYDAPSKKIKRNIARANGYLRRGEYLKAIEAARKAFVARPILRLMGQEKVEVDFVMMEFCDNFNNNPGLLVFLEELGITVKPFLVYRAQENEEKAVLERMDAVHQRWEAKEREVLEQKERALEERREELLRKGQECLDKGELPRGKSYLRRLGDEFGHLPGVLRDIGIRLEKKDLTPDAVEFFVAAIGKDKTDAKSFSLAVKAYREMGDFDSAEGLYIQAIKTFGGHPRTYLNLAKLYMQWRKRDKAFDFARRALDGDPDLEEAKELVRKTQ